MNPKRSFKNLFTVVLFLLFWAPLKAQLTHTLGATLPFAVRKYQVYGGGKNTDAYYLAMLSYGFRYNLTASDNSSFSIGPLVSAGGGVYNNGWGTGFLYSGDVQAWADYNTGLGAVEDSETNSGSFFGVGFGGSYTGADGEAIDDDNGFSFGPMLRAGFRFNTGEAPLSVAFYYKHGIENAKWRTFGFHVLADL